MPGKGDSYRKPPFLGAIMLVVGRVFTKHVMPESRRFPELVPCQLLAGSFLAQKVLQVLKMGGTFTSVCLVSWLTLFLKSKTIGSRIFFFDFWFFIFGWLPQTNNMSEQNQSIWWLDIVAAWLFFLLKKTPYFTADCLQNVNPIGCRRQWIKPTYPINRASERPHPYMDLNRKIGMQQLSAKDPQHYEDSERKWNGMKFWICGITRKKHHYSTNKIITTNLF